MHNTKKMLIVRPMATRQTQAPSATKWVENWQRLSHRIRDQDRY